MPNVVDSRQLRSPTVPQGTHSIRQAGHCSNPRLRLIMPAAMSIKFDMTASLIFSPRHCPCFLQSHKGDVEEAISFLELTSLTATPGQLTQLGLLPTRERSTPICVPQPAGNGASSGARGQAASPPASQPADVAAVDGEDPSRLGCLETATSASYGCTLQASLSRLPDCWIRTRQEQHLAGRECYSWALCSELNREGLL